MPLSTDDRERCQRQISQCLGGQRPRCSPGALVKPDLVLVAGLEAWRQCWWCWCCRPFAAVTRHLSSKENDSAVVGAGRGRAVGAAHPACKHSKHQTPAPGNPHHRESSRIPTIKNLQHQRILVKPPTTTRNDRQTSSTNSQRPPIAEPIVVDKKPISTKHQLRRSTRSPPTQGGHSEAPISTSGT